MIDFNSIKNRPKIPDLEFKSMPVSPLPTPSPTGGSLSPYIGEWGVQQAAHLLRRATFGPTIDQIKSVAEMGMEAALDLLFQELPLPDPPVNPYFDGNDNPNNPLPADPEVGVGETWVNAGYNPVNFQTNYRHQSLRSWSMEQMVNEELSIREKMVLFWHNHFVVADIQDARFLYRYITTLRANALGDFKQLVKDITIDPAMLRYLNGNQNVKQAPNENYARELLELFTIGKGELAGPGDYTTFTEDDVVEIARVLTGWVDYGSRNPNISIDPKFGSVFENSRHDIWSKSLSHRFDNAVINNSYQGEYKKLIDVIFTRDEVSRFISRKLYRWFIYYEITEEVEANVIEPMAAMIRDHNYQIKPALKALLASEHFYHEDQFGCHIKNPIDFVVSFFKQFEIPVEGDLNRRHRFWLSVFQFTAILQMEYFSPPSVAGWKAYYQEPAYYQSWINSVTLPLRTYLTDLLNYSGVGEGDGRIVVDPLSFIAKLESPLDVNAMIDEIGLVIYPKPLTEAQRNALKDVLIPGLPDFEWNLEYSDYLADPDNQEKKKAVEDR